MSLHGLAKHELDTPCCNIPIGLLVQGQLREWAAVRGCRRKEKLMFNLAYLHHHFWKPAAFQSELPNEPSPSPLDSAS